ncbi:MAG: hypothetical protein RL385_2765 [Pseudomonadota bacterium]|jgi:type II secretory pathway predicted ATPase ExeA
MSEGISPDANDLHEEVALFRYGLIADLALEPEHTHGLYLRLADKAAQEYTIPGTLRRRVAVETLRGWLRAYRRGGFDALLPRQRADRGSARAIPRAVVDVLCQLEDDEPKLKLAAMIKKARAEHREAAQRHPRNRDAHHHSGGATRGARHAAAGRRHRRRRAVLMYRKHFALTRHPFDKALAADDLFPSAWLAERTLRLNHLVDMRGIGLVTGDSGSGKTTTCRRVVADLHAGLHRVFYVSMPTGNVVDMYKSIAWELGPPTARNRAGPFKQIRAEVSRLCAENRLRPVLVVDEAHHLRTELLEDLRLLTNYAMDSENRLTVVLVGHPELRRRMGMAALRISV